MDRPLIHGQGGASSATRRSTRDIAARAAAARAPHAQPCRLAAPSAPRLPSARRCPVHASAAPDPSLPAAAAELPPLSLSLRGARQRLLSLLDGGGAPDAAAVGAALDELIRENPSLTPGLDTPAVGVGVWEVFHAPHISRMSGALGTKFDPIRYTLAPGGGFVSNVRFSNPVVGTGWLSASGALTTHDESSVKVSFTDFWVDLGDNLRPTIGRGGNGSNGNGGAKQGALPPWVDPLVEVMGRALFLPQLSVFPVLYLDPEISVFQFPPLSSNIAVRRVAGGGSGSSSGSSASE